MVTEQQIKEIAERKDDGLSVGDSKRNKWHDEHVDADMETLLDAVDERDTLLREIVDSAHAAEDAGDFVLWVQEHLATWKSEGDAS